MKRITFFLIPLTLLHCYTNVTAQSNSPYHLETFKVMAQSPNAAAIAKYGDIPVSTYTGIPSIDIPIYEVRSGSLKLPVGLNYHAGGIKVEDIASWAGLGWTLNVGGSITRVLRGIEDEEANGYFATGYQVNDFGTMNSTNQYNYYDDVRNGAKDSEPDLFNYSIGAFAGQFFSLANGTLVSKSQSRVKFQYGTYFSKTGWKLTDVDGTVYYFLDKEESSSAISSITGGSPNSNYRVSAWMISKIYSVNQLDSIIFEYDQVSYSFNSMVAQTRYEGYALSGDCPSKSTESSFSCNNMATLLLKKIKFKHGEIDFYKHGTQRNDLHGTYKIDKLTIKNTDSSFSKSILFHHSYVSAGSGDLEATDTTVKNRVYLDSLDISTSGTVIERYKFEYIDRSNLPSRLSYNQDFWGYYNGSSNSTTFIPNYILVNSGGAKLMFAGADRNPDSLSMQAGTLKKITYPTGGTTEIKYEPNRVGNFLGKVDNGFDLKDDVGFHQLTGDGNGIITYYTDTFTIASSFGRSGGVMAKILVGLPNSGVLPPPPVTLDDPAIVLTYPNSTTKTLRNNTTLFLPTGQYTMTVDFSGNPDPDLIHDFYISFLYEYGITADSIKLLNTMVGGLRAKEVIVTDNVTGVASATTYEYTNPSTGNSSGNLVNFPTFASTITESYEDLSSVVYNCVRIAISSTASNPLTATKGSYVGYTSVTEYAGTGSTKHKKTSSYSFADDLGSPTVFPYPPSNSREEFRGRLLTENQYKYSETFSLLAQKQLSYNASTYISNDSLTKKSPGIKFGQNVFYNFEPAPIGSHLVSYINSPYDTETGFTFLKKDSSALLGDNSQWITTEQAFSYSPSLNVAAVTTTDSKGDSSIIETTYPMDFATTGSMTEKRAQAIEVLKSKNLQNELVEKRIFKKAPAGSKKLLFSTFYGYDKDRFRPDTIWALTTSSLLSDFSPAAIVSNSLTRDSRYAPEIIVNQYDMTGNILSQQKLNDVKSAYIWDYKSAYPIAEVIDGDSASVAMTSFEAESKGYWTFSGSTSGHPSAPTGKKGYSLAGGNITRSGLSSGTTYVITYWKRDTSSTVTVNSASGTNLATRNGWKLYRHEITGTTSLTIAGTAYIDELRLHPKSALMKTYTYNPLVGVTSESDANNKIVYYEYDAIGRLKLVKDDEGRVLKRMDYKYQATYQQ